MISAKLGRGLRAEPNAYVLHDANSLLRLSDELVLSLLNLGTGLLAQLFLHTIFAASLLSGESKSTTLGVGLGGIKVQARVLDGLAGACRKHDVGVQSGAPAGQEPALDLSILRQPGLADLLAGDGKLLESSGKRILASARLLTGKHVGAVQRSAGDGMAEGLGLGLRGGRCSEGGLSLSWRGSGRQEVDLLGDGTAEVVEGLADVGGVVVGLVGVLGAVRGGGQI